MIIKKKNGPPLVCACLVLVMPPLSANIYNFTLTPLPHPPLTKTVNRMIL